jgi:hypothetical protein
VKSTGIFVAGLGIFALLLTGCAKNIDTPEAVRDGVIKDIGKKVDVQNMDVSVESVSFREKEATANVSFRPKGGPAGQSITMTYSMVRQGDEWHVKDRNMQRHEQAQPGGAGTAPPIDPGKPLPPGHPAMPIPGTGTTGQLPAGSLPSGHPPLTQ